MNRITLQNRIVASSAVAAALAVGALTQSAKAVPVNGQYVDDTRCDPIATQFLSHELGEVGFFPLNEAYTINVTPSTTYICVPNDNFANDWTVDIMNVSGIAWTNLFFVANLGTTIGNSDGQMRDLVGAPTVFTDAFRIDAQGINNNLQGESQINDGIFAPGESWRFVVTNFGMPVGVPPFPVITRTPGIFAGSDPLIIPPTSTASILATPVPEPTTVGAIALAAAALLMRRPGRSAR